MARSPLSFAFDTRMSQEKIFLDPHELAERLEALRRDGKSVVTANGCFELLHVGHLRYLEAAKELGDILVVAVNTDESMRRIKPDRRPVNVDTDRYELLAALEMVDFVVPLADTTPMDILDVLKPDVHTKGTDYAIEDIPERVVVERHGGRVELVGGPKIRNTKDMLRDLKAPNLLS